MRRPAFRADQPVQITLRCREDVPSLRDVAAWAALVRVMRAIRERGDVRVVHYAVLSNHIHAIVEADDAHALELGMRSLATRLALRLNRCFSRRGRLFDHRFHMRVLTSPREVRFSLQYVLLNARKHAAEHGIQLPAGWIDRRSAALVFDGWTVAPQPAERRDYGTAEPRTWLLRHGWRRAGLLELGATPGSVAVDSALVVCERDHGRRRAA